MISRYLYCLAFLLALGARSEISFSRDIQPLLSDRCFACHGPDGGKHGEKWRGGLRLDTKEDAFGNMLLVKHATQTKKRAEKGLAPLPKPTKTRHAIVPGDPDASIMMQRILSDDPDEVMPPTDSHLSLTKGEKELLRKWIAEGAKWDKHWAFVTPERTKLPETKQTDWPITEVDHFVLASFEQGKIQPAPAVDKAAWLRRVTQDLTGLPPTIAALDAFNADDSPDAYEKAVDKLLRTPHFAERMTGIWLDNARYADSNSFQFDNARTMWPWRDWVINAYQQNMPYDQFVKEQLAGDLLPNPTQAQLIATGFNRNHGYSIEGGIIDEEYRVTYANDKTTTAGTLFMGLTMECTRCHDHKYDPLSMKDYYSLYAFFNTSAEVGAPGEKGRHQKAAAPFIDYQTDDDQKQGRWHAFTPQSATADKQTLKIVDNTITAKGKIPHNDVYRIKLKPTIQSIRSLHLNVLATNGRVGRADHKNFVLTNLKATLVANGQSTPLTFAKAQATYNQNNFHVNGAIDQDPTTGWAVHPQTRKNHAAAFELTKAVAIPKNALLHLELSFASVHKQQVLGSFQLSGSSESLAKMGLTKQSKSVRAMVMKEKPRKSYILNEGLFDQPGAEVQPETPEVLSSFNGYAPNRLGLANWLAGPENPVFARVAVNRMWQQFFGRGLVRTPDNFGIQGEQPTHPKLLDWLAVEFRESGWNTHHLIRKIVLSATYQQSSNFRPNLDDADNRLLAQGPSFRLPAELIRDQALAIGNLLNPQIGGPSVKPYQPKGVWEDLNAPKSHAEVYVQDKGNALYRKSMYTYWRRAALHPALATFDAPSRDVCTVERPSTNTPLQALVTLHAPIYVEAARTLAADLVNHPKPIQTGFRTILSRNPTEQETKLLQQLHTSRLNHYQTNPTAVAKTITVGNSAPPKSSHPQIAALTDVYHTILNLSESITRK